MQSGFHLLQSAEHRVMIILAAPGIARNPSAVRVVEFDRVRMLRVVIDGTDDNTSRPGGDAGERGTLKIAALVTRFQVFHFAGVASGYPLGKMFVLGRIGSGSDAREVEAGFLGGTLDDGLNVIDRTCHFFLIPRL